MLLEFRLANFRSIREEQALSFVSADRLKTNEDIPRVLPGQKDRVLPAIGIYGANASGKSNVLNGLLYMQEAVLNSYRLWKPDGGMPRSPFAWGDSPAKESLFEVDIVAADNDRYSYGFAISDEKVLEEWLIRHDSSGKKHDVLRRCEDEINVKNVRHAETFDRRLLKHVTRTNSLFLSSAVQLLSMEEVKPVYQFFNSIRFPHSKEERYFQTLRSRRVLGALGYPDIDSISPPLFPSLSSSSTVDAEALLIEKVRQVFNVADVGIVDIRKEDTDNTELGLRGRSTQYSFQHESESGDSWLPYREESEGTKTLFRLAPSLIDAIEKGGLVVLDELESSFHPMLAAKVVELFNCPKTNKKNAQLLFTTHDTNLLGNTTGEPVLRRDQVWLTEKDRTGATKLYPVTDFHPRKNENLERGYLQGRYGATPFIDKILHQDP